MFSALFLTHENPLVVCPVDAHIWILHTPFEFVCQRHGDEYRVTVPANFVTDFASIPRILWPIAPRWGVYGWAAVIHDFLYWDQGITRREADDIFLSAMNKSEVPLWQRETIYRAVRWCGCKAWKHNTTLKARNPCARIWDRPLPDPFHFKEWRAHYRQETT
jgi:hypothetical protein